MAGNNSSQREQKKARIRNNMLDGRKKRNVSIRVPAVIKMYKMYIAAAVLALAVLVLLITAVVKLYGYFRTYSTYEVNWAVEISNASTAECVEFVDGILLVGKDGAILYGENGLEKWMVSYEMKSPTAVTEGNYVLFYDRNGRTMVVCDKNGYTGNMSTSYPISRADISASGVSVAVLEDTTTSYISYYRNTGEALEVNIQSPIATSGYPLDISISPNGQQLIVSYYYLSEGKGCCRVDFYDFEKGKDKPDRIVGTFSYKESDTYIPFTVYRSNSEAFSVGDNQLQFYSVSNRTQIEQKTVAVSGEIKKVFYDDTYLGLLLEDEDGLKICIYDANGKKQGEFSQDRIYDVYCFDGKQILIYNENHCRIVTFSGRTRLDLEFVNQIGSLGLNGNQKSFYLVTMDVLQRITLK